METSPNSQFTWTSLAGYILKGTRRRLFKMRYLFLIPILYAVNEVLADDVVELTSKNFDEGIRKFKTALVMFHAPWCGHCKILNPEFELAAQVLKNHDNPIQLVRVDCAGEGKEVCHEFNIRGYPTLKIFREGIYTKDYKGSRKRSALIDYMKMEVGPPAENIGSEKDLLNFLDEPRVAVVGFFDSESDLKNAFLGAAESLKDTIKFGMTSLMAVGQGIQMFQPKYLKNKFETPVRSYEGIADSNIIRDWILKNKHGLVGYRRSSNEDDFTPPLVVAYYNIDYRKNPKGTNYWRNRVLKVAQDYQNDFNFAISSRSEYRQELSQFGLGYFLNDKPVVTARMADGKKYKMISEFSVAALKEFLSALKDGTAEQYIKSEDIPKKIGPVIKAVGKNFNDVVNDSCNNTFITFSAPWCDHCKQMAPIWEELAKEMEDEEVDIVKFNAADNDFPPYFVFDGYPTLFWLPKDRKSEPHRYNGPRSLEDFIKFIASNVKNELKNFNRDGSRKVKPENVHLNEEL